MSRQREDTSAARRRRLTCLAPGLLAVILGGQSAPAPGERQDAGPEGAPGAESPPASWAVVCAWLREQVDRLAADLEAAHAALLARAERESPELAERLVGTPPAARRSGWGVLPEIGADKPYRPVETSERRYALRDISVNFASSFRDGRILAEHTSLDASAPLERAVRDYERLQGDLKNVKEHLAYHEQWQRAVTEQSAFFAGRNEIVEKVRAMREAVDQGTDPARVDRLQAEVRDGVALFEAAPGLALERANDGALVLPLAVHTDVTDAAFLDAFRAAVLEEWNGSEAARARRLSIRLDLVHVPIGELYPDGPPSPGQEIDVQEHVSRFPQGALVMTTGAASTHAWKGRSLLLGPSATSPRQLAHEFGHLLGFGDAYLRGYDGKIGDPHGVVLVEWTGLLDHLMGNPAGGRVTDALVDRLVEAYGGE